MPNAIGTNAIGPSFGSELAANGLGGKGFAWGSDGSFEWNGLSSDQQSAVLAIFAKHNPTNVDPNAAYNAARSNGVQVASTGTPALSGTYGCSAIDQLNMTTAQGLAGLGVFPGFFKNYAGAKITMTAAQFATIATAITTYVLELEAAQDAANGPGGSWVAPSATATIA